MKFKPNKTGITVIVVIILLLLLLTFKKRKTIKQVAMKTINWIKEKSWDIHSDRRIMTLHPDVRAKAKEFIIRAEKELGIKLRITSALRTFKEQQNLYNQGRTTSGKIVTNAKPGSSFHNYGLAFDVVEIKGGKALWSNPNWDKIAALGKEVGFEWGGDWTSFKDKPHFQMAFSKRLSELKSLYQSGNKTGEYVNIT